MEIMMSKNDFDFDSMRSTPYTTAPSTPKRFGQDYFSALLRAPPSPEHLSERYRDFDDFYVDDTKSCSDISPVAWWEDETDPLEPNVKREKTIFDDCFAFDVSSELPMVTLPAEELFDGGKIRPLKPPIKDETRKKHQSLDIKSSNNSSSNTGKKMEQERGRGRNVSALPSNSSRRGARSVSPFRVSKYPWEEEEEYEEEDEDEDEYEEEEMKSKRNQKQPVLSSKPELTSTTSTTTSKSSKKWSLKDLFLFRSISEGRSLEKDPIRKYTDLFRKKDEKKLTSNKMSEGASVSKRRGQVSAHELHYMKNRAVSEDLKKKTFLPYKQGIFGRLSFNPATHGLSNGFGNLRK